MSGLFNAGLSGLKAFQAAITLTSHNVSNAETEGYNRREIILSQSSLEMFGNGVDVAGIRRIVDQVALENLQKSASIYQSSNVYFEYAQNLQSIAENPNISPNQALSNAFDALQKVNSNPGATYTRNLVFNQFEILSNRFRSLAQNINQEYTKVNTEIVQASREINDITSKIASINAQIPKMDPNESLGLLDEREKLLQSLAERISFKTYSYPNGTMDVLIGAGNPLVIGATANKMTPINDSENSQIVNLSLTVGTTQFDVSNALTSGKVRGLINYREDVLKPMERELNRLALVISDKFNQQNKAGVDLNGNLGGNLFLDVNHNSLTGNRILPNGTNTGSAAMNATINDVSALTTSDYRMVIGASNQYSLVRISDNTEVAQGTLGSFPQRVSVDGFDINIATGTFNNGDTYLISPTRNAAYQFSLATKDPTALAVALPIRTTANSGNTGTGQISKVSITDITNSSFSLNKQLNPPIRIEFLSSTSYRLVNANTNAAIESPISYNPSATNTVFPTPGGYDPGYQIELSGGPKTGDIFNIDYNINGQGDNQNGNLMSNLFNTRTLNNQQMTFNEAFNDLVSNISIKVQSIQISQRSDKIIFEQAQAKRDSISGVNVDEETVNLLKFEKAYQASANVVATASKILDILLSLGQR